MFEALLRSVRDNLQKSLDVFNVGEESIRITEGPEAPAEAGQVFIGVYCDDVIPTEQNGGIIVCTEFGVTVALSFRTPFVPPDRRGENIYTDVGEEEIISIEEIAARIVRTLAGHYKIIFDANQNKPPAPYTEPLVLGRSIGKPRPVTAEHFGVQFDEEEENSDYAGLLLELYFVGGKQFSSPYSYV